jgi:hypothetical protein
MKIFPVGAELFNADGRTHKETDGRTDGQRDRNTEMTKHFAILFTRLEMKFSTRNLKTNKLTLALKIN